MRWSRFTNATPSCVRSSTGGTAPGGRTPDPKRRPPPRRGMGAAVDELADRSTVSRRATAEEEGGADHHEGEREVKPVVGVVDRHEVRAGRAPGDESVDPEDQVDDPAEEQVGAGCRVAAG